MDTTDIRKETRLNCNESFLTLLSGARKVGSFSLTAEDKAYNNALADIFDYIIENETLLLEHTKRCGKWVRD